VKLGQCPRRQEAFAYNDSVIMKSVIQRQFRLVFINGIAQTFTTKIPYGFISLNYIIPNNNVISVLHTYYWYIRKYFFSDTIVHNIIEMSDT